MIARLKKAAQAFGRNVSAVTAIQFGMLAPTFLILVFAIFGNALVFIGEMTLDNAVARVGRQVRTGEIAKSAMSEADFRKAVCKAAISLFSCSKLKIDVRGYSNYASLPKGPPLKGSWGSKTLDTSGFGYDVGASDEIMAVQVYYEWPIFISYLQSIYSGLGSKNYLVGSMWVFRTEPFDEN